MMTNFFFKSIKCHTFLEPQAQSDLNDEDDNDDDDDINDNNKEDDDDDNNNNAYDIKTDNKEEEVDNE